MNPGELPHQTPGKGTVNFYEKDSQHTMHILLRPGGNRQTKEQSHLVGLNWTSAAVGNMVADVLWLLKKKMESYTHRMCHFPNKSSCIQNTKQKQTEAAVWKLRRKQLNLNNSLQLKTKLLTKHSQLRYIATEWVIFKKKKIPKYYIKSNWGWPTKYRGNKFCKLTLVWNSMVTNKMNWSCI